MRKGPAGKTSQDLFYIESMTTKRLTMKLATVKIATVKRATVKLALTPGINNPFHPYQEHHHHGCELLPS